MSIQKPHNNPNGKQFQEKKNRHYCDIQYQMSYFKQYRPFSVLDQFPQNIPYQGRLLLPPYFYTKDISVNITSKYIIHKYNQKEAQRTKTYALAWQPDGRRLFQGDDNGNITVYNGYMFKYEFHIDDKDQRHKIKDLIWAHSGDYLMALAKEENRESNREKSKAWTYQNNLNKIGDFEIPKANKDKNINKVHQFVFSPNDRKVAIACDRTVALFDVSAQTIEAYLDVDDSDISCVDWHPSESLIVCAGKGNKLKFFDPRVSDGINSIDGVHTNDINRVVFNHNGYHILSCGKDQKVVVCDTRAMGILSEHNGSKSHVNCASWHPFDDELFVSAGYNGEIHWWITGLEKPVYSNIQPNTQKLRAVHQVKFSPFGHVLASVGHEGVVKFWTRPIVGTCKDTSTKSEALMSESNDIPGLIRHSDLKESSD